MAKREIGPVRTALLVTVAILLTVAACEAPAPSAVEDADGPEVVRLSGSLSESPLSASMRVDGHSPIVYIDGVRLGGATGTDLSELHPDAIERIEVVKGAAAVKFFGEEASVGVIQIFTKEGEVPFGPAMDVAAPGEGARLRIRGSDEPPTGGDRSPARLRARSDAPDLAFGVGGALETAHAPRVYVDGELFDGGLSAIDPASVDRVEVVGTPDAREIQVFLKQH